MKAAKGIFFTIVIVSTFFPFAHLFTLSASSSVNLFLKSSDDIPGNPRTLDVCIIIVAPIVSIKPFFKSLTGISSYKLVLIVN